MISLAEELRSIESDIKSQLETIQRIEALVAEAQGASEKDSFEHRRQMIFLRAARQCCQSLYRERGRILAQSAASDGSVSDRPRSFSSYFYGVAKRLLPSDEFNQIAAEAKLELDVAKRRRSDSRFAKE